jgi:hypothetical protein
MRTDRCGNTSGKKCHAKRSIKETTNVVYEMNDHTSNNWNHRNANERFKVKFGSHTRCSDDVEPQDRKEERGTT